MEIGPIIAAGIAILVIITLINTARIVPQKSAYIVERLGKYSRTLNAGFHILTPFLDRVAYKHSLKEQAADIAEQVCITKDNVQVGVDGVLYLQVLDAGDYSRIQTLDGHYDVIRCMTAALDRYVITGSSSKDGSIMVWSLIPETV